MSNYKTVFFTLAAAVLSIPMLSSCQATNTPAESTPVANTSTSSSDNKSSKDDASCYVHLFDDDNFGDDNDIIYGPGKWGNLRDLPDATETDWEDEADSLKVGPTATVKVWQKEDFQGDSKTFDPDTQHPKLDIEMRSMEITCR